MYTSASKSLGVPQSHFLYTWYTVLKDSFHLVTSNQPKLGTIPFVILNFTQNMGGKSPEI